MEVLIYPSLPRVYDKWISKKSCPRTRLYWQRLAPATDQCACRFLKDLLTLPEQKKSRTVPRTRA